ncbi:hypothetical protein TYRP_022461 [Tyrophagus putrescentiae]|nr:hypothetical protein TYRP_022461 [Tyrophagus putrescentiae]
MVCETLTDSSHNVWLKEQLKAKIVLEGGNGEVLREDGLAFDEHLSQIGDDKAELGFAVFKSGSFWKRW